MTPEYLKQRMRNKFGSINKFCVLSGTNISKLNNILRMKESHYKRDAMERINKLITSTKVSPTDWEVTEELTQKIRITILTKYKNIHAFCVKHKITDKSMSLLLNNKVVFINQMVRNVCTILGINV